MLKRVLHSLSCGKFKILKKTEAEGNDADPKKAARKVFEDDSFEFNAGFQSKTRNFRVPMASLDDTGNVRKRVDEDRGQQIEACIVRVMKARKTLGHQQLVSEVLNQLQSFRPAPAMIKQKIDLKKELRSHAVGTAAAAAAGGYSNYLGLSDSAIHRKVRSFHVQHACTQRT